MREKSVPNVPVVRVLVLQSDEDCDAGQGVGLSSGRYGMSGQGQVLLSLEFYPLQGSDDGVLLPPWVDDLLKNVPVCHIMGELRSEISRILCRCTVVCLTLVSFVGIYGRDIYRVIIRNRNEYHLRKREARDAVRCVFAPPLGRLPQQVGAPQLKKRRKQRPIAFRSTANRLGGPRLEQG